MRHLQPKKAQLRQLIILLVVVIAAMAMISKCSHAPSSPFAQEYRRSGGDTLDIAIEMSPTIYAVRGDTIVGKDYEILAGISHDKGVPMKFHPFVPLKYALDGLERGDFDIVVASIPATAQIKERFLLTDPVYLDREVLVQLRDTLTGRGPISSTLQLAGDTLWIAQDSPFASRIANLADEIGDSIYIMSAPEYSAEHLFILTALGQVRLAVVNETVAKAMHDRYPQVDISTPISFTQFQSWVVRDSALLDSLNIWLK